MAKIVYLYRGQPYLNITNACSAACTFCIRGKDNALWHEREPAWPDILQAVDAFDFSGFSEAVFCGYGEPTMALENLLETCRYLKKTYPSLRLRLNTNGHSDLIHGRPTARELAPYIDAVSISLNAADPETYMAVTRPAFGAAAYEAVLRFAKDCKALGMDTAFSVVDIIGENGVAAAKKLAKSLGIPLKVRGYV